MSDRVAESEIILAPPRDRCLWGAVCAEALTQLYSPYFQQLFNTETAFSLVWDYIANDHVDAKKTKQYLRKCSRLSGSDEAYIYGLPNGMLAALVAELLYPTGASVVECIGYCARLYPSILFFKHGYDDRVYNFNRRHIDSLIDQFNKFSRSVFEFVSQKSSDYSRDFYRSQFSLDSDIFGLPIDMFIPDPPITGKKEPTVPAHEIIR